MKSALKNPPELDKLSQCKWKLEDEDYNAYATDCGQCFCIEEGTPQENSMLYCCYCGRVLVVYKS